jgi:hypothetical protein
MLELRGGVALAVFLFVITPLPFSSQVSADEVTLSTGGRIEGEIISQDNQQVVLQTAYGKVTFQTADVSKVAFSSPMEKQIRLQLSGLAPSDVAGRLKLADAAAGAGLKEFANGIYTQVIAIQPDEKTARKALGYVFYEGEWVSARDKDLHPGLVPYKGRWVRVEEREALRQGDAERAYYANFGLSTQEGTEVFNSIVDMEIRIEPRGGYVVRRHVKTWPVKDKPYFYSTDILNWQRLGVFIGVNFIDSSRKKVKGFGALSWTIYAVKADALGNPKVDRELVSGTVEIAPEMYAKESDFSHWDTKVNGMYDKVVSDGARSAWAAQEYMNAGGTIYVLANRAIDALSPPGVYYVEATFTLKDRVKKAGRYVQYQELR